MECFKVVYCIILHHTVNTVEHCLRFRCWQVLSFYSTSIQTDKNPRTARLSR